MKIRIKTEKFSKKELEEYKQNPQEFLEKRKDDIADIPGEEWKTIDGYGGNYEISSYGRVKTKIRVTKDGRHYPAKILAQTPSRGALYVKVRYEGKQRNLRIETLLEKYFLMYRDEDYYRKKEHEKYLEEHREINKIKNERRRAERKYKQEIKRIEERATNIHPTYETNTPTKGELIRGKYILFHTFTKRSTYYNKKEKLMSETGFSEDTVDKLISGIIPEFLGYKIFLTPLGGKEYGTKTDSL